MSFVGAAMGAAVRAAAACGQGGCGGGGGGDTWTFTLSKPGVRLQRHGKRAEQVSEELVIFSYVWKISTG